MRIWSIHPEYLDARGLVALWRETLLAQNVLLGKTKGYKNHPQLERFKNSINPVGAVASYLRRVADEADKRGYNFNRDKITRKRFQDKIPVTTGQLEYEFQHLLQQLKSRDPGLHALLKTTKPIKTHPIFRVIKGPVEKWEIL